jgi:uncharacterized protein (TIGR00255 family)
VVRSMTGYGRAKQSRNGRNITVELRSVNNRYLDCTVKMPRAFIFAEDAIKNLVQKGVGRGKVDVFITVESAGAEETVVTVNESLANSYVAVLKQLRTIAGECVTPTFQVTELARLPDILTITKAEEDLETISADLCAVAEEAIAAHAAMRETEGKRLAEDVLSRAETISNLLSRVEERAPGIVEDYRARLTAKLQEVLGNTQIDEGRILAEAAIYADKVAVDEETVRLRSHLSQLREMLEQGGAIGRKLDFLIQEFNREANTIGSKCSDIETSRLVVDIKAEIEKIREQIQNIE